MSQELLDAIVERARRTFSAQACSILVHEPESNSLVFAAMSGEGAESLVGVKIPDTTGVAGRVLVTREPLLLDDAPHDRRFAEDVAEVIGYVPRRLMAAPLLRADRVLGVLEVLDGPPHAECADANQLREFADDAARAIAEFYPG